MMEKKQFGCDKPGGRPASRAMDGKEDLKKYLKKWIDKNIYNNPDLEIDYRDKRISEIEKRMAR